MGIGGAGVLWRMCALVLASFLLAACPGGGGGGGGSEDNPEPEITGASPDPLVRGAADTTVTVTGTGFIDDSTVRWNGGDRTTTFVSSSSLEAVIPASDLGVTGSGDLTVFNPAPGGGVSDAFTVAIENPLPATASLAPAAAQTGGGDFTLTVTGTGFVADSVVQWDGAERPTTVVSDTELQAEIAAGDIAAGGLVDVTVATPALGGGTSGAQVFTINNPAPAPGGLAPNSAQEGGAAFDLVVTGDGFVPGSVVRWNGADRATTVDSSMQLTARITAADIVAIAPVTVTVFNPPPSGGEAGTPAFTITPIPPPRIDVGGLSPDNGPAGSGFVLTINGSGFIDNPVTAVDWFLGTVSSLTPTTITSTQITVAIPAAQTAVAGTAQITVRNFGGGTSNQVPFVVNPLPGIDAGGLTPDNGPTGTAITGLTIAGSNFQNAAATRVLWGAAELTPTAITPTQITVDVSALDLGGAGAVNVRVRNADGGLSNTEVFTVNPLPGIDANGLSPASGPAGAAIAGLTIAGSNFQNAAATRVLWGAAELTPSAITPTQITVDVSALDLGGAGAVNVQVRNADGGLSNTEVFTVTPPPAIAGLSRDTAFAGESGFDLTVTGTDFVDGAAVLWDGDPRVTVFGSTTELSATIPATDLAAVGTPAVSVRNPDGGLSTSLTFTINPNPVPLISALSPSVVVAGDTGVTLTVAGSGFNSLSVVRWNGAPLATTFDAGPPAQLTAPLADMDISLAAVIPVTVVNPAPGGGTSNLAHFDIRDGAAPVISALSQTSVQEGAAAFSLVVTGQNFNPDGAMHWNGLRRPTTVDSDTQVTGDVFPVDVAEPGCYPLTVSTSVGGTSEPRTFTVENAGGSDPCNTVPEIRNLQPRSTTSGAPVTVDVIGRGFAADSVVLWNGQSGGVTTFVSDTLLQYDMIQADLDNTVDNVAAVTVTTPARAGPPASAAAISQPAPFFVLNGADELFFDNFTRPDNPDVGNGWTERNEQLGLFAIAGNVARGIASNRDYIESMVYRPSDEDRRDVETAIEFIRRAGNDQPFAQVHARIQRNIIANPVELHSYLFFISDSITPVRATLAVQPPGSLSCYMLAIPFPGPLVPGERYRLRLQVTGPAVLPTDPVVVTGIVEQFDRDPLSATLNTWVTFASGTVQHDALLTPPPGLFCAPATMPPPITGAGGVGFSSNTDTPEAYDNFYWRDWPATP